MFYELIYTRCRQGMDITKKGQQISSDGYKVYSCTPAIMEEGKVDLQFLANAVQAKQSFTDPDFMDDAYLYYVPDTGAAFLVNFFPVPFDANAQGDYSRRPGNFLNHALIGDFSNFYPYELFKDESVWSAKTKGEAYYYENLPSALPERNDISDPPGQYGFDEIGSFIKDGREEAFKKAVSFLILQYKEEPEKRKYIVIKDDSSKNIELWIAAIECAFSPKIASVIPFASRMEKFTNVNKYTVKLGLFQTQINLQDPNHKQRFRAMIVGVDERDKANAGLSRPLANSPFVLLDGCQKQAMFDADISHPYYRFVARFDDEHRDFCRIFLQDSKISIPSSDIHYLYEVFSGLTGPVMPNVRLLPDMLNKLSKYQAANKTMLRNIYDNINNNIMGFVQEDFSCGLNITNWLLEASKTTGDNDAKQRLTEIVCDVFVDSLFNISNINQKHSNWEIIQHSEFSVNAARNIIDITKIEQKIVNIQSSPTEYAIFVRIYLEASLLLGVIDHNNLKRIIKFGIKVCFFNGRDVNTLKNIVSFLSQISSINEKEFLLDLITNEDDIVLSEFIINFIIDSDPSIITSDASMLLFYKKFKDGLNEQIKILIIKKRINNLNKPSDIESFVKILQDIPLRMLGKEKLAEIFELLSTKFSIDILIEYLIKLKFSNSEQLFILEVLFFLPEGYFSGYVKELLPTANKNKDKWNAFCSYVYNSRNEKMSDIIIKEIVNIKKYEKLLTSLVDMIEENMYQRYFKEIAARAKESKQ